MRILAFKRSVPWPLASGQHLASCHVLGRLARSHEVLLACWEGEQRWLAELPFPALLRRLPGGSARPRSVRGAGGSDRWLSAHYGMDPRSKRWLGALLADFRPAVLLGIDYQALPALDAHRAVPSVCYLIDNRWLEAVERLRREKGRRWGNLKSVLWSYGLHRRYARAADVYVFVSQREAAALARFTDRPCVGVPNGVDSDYFRPAGTARDPNAVVFVGSLDFPPNLEAVEWFCRQVWPRVRREHPAARLTLVGKNPLASVRAWDGRQAIRVAGQVPDVRPYLDAAAVAVVPMRSGGGIKNKVLEAWAMARPVVATSMSLHGLSARVGENILTADDPAGFAAHVRRLLSDPALGSRIGLAGRAAAVRDHGWERTARRIEACLAQALRRPGPDYSRHRTRRARSVAEQAATAHRQERPAVARE